jgi:hypothetical protein
MRTADIGIQTRSQRRTHTEIAVVTNNITAITREKSMANQPAKPEDKGPTYRIRWNDGSPAVNAAWNNAWNKITGGWGQQDVASGLSDMSSFNKALTLVSVYDPETKSAAVYTITNEVILYEKGREVLRVHADPYANSPLLFKETAEDGTTYSCTPPISTWAPGIPYVNVYSVHMRSPNGGPRNDKDLDNQQQAIATYNERIQNFLSDKPGLLKGIASLESSSRAGDMAEKITTANSAPTDGAFDLNILSGTTAEPAAPEKPTAPEKKDPLLSSLEPRTPISGGVDVKLADIGAGVPVGMPKSAQAALA